MAAVAFAPVALCSGYSAGWLTNVERFRSRSFIERLFWSLPLSFSISGIFAVLMARLTSIFVVEILVLSTVPICLFTLIWERLRRSHSENRCDGGCLRPLGFVAMLVVGSWVALVLVTLVDLQQGQNLYPSLFQWDHSARIAWTESVIHTGVPPDNPLYYFRHPAPLRNYYFWYVLCAVVVKFSGLPARAVMTASCAWAGFALAATIGLYLKHFLCVGVRLRKQFIVAVLLLGVTGLDVCANIVQILIWHKPLTLDLEWWSGDAVYSWYGSLFWVPHHVTGLVCCLLAFLLAWKAEDHRLIARIAISVGYIAAALASCFGYSIFMAVGFFLIMLAWALWQLSLEGKRRAVMCLGAGGLLGTILLMPFLSELSHNPANADGGGAAARHLFAFSIRELIPASSVLGIEPLRSLGNLHPAATEILAKLVLLLPGYAIELGFYGLVLIVYLKKWWRRRNSLSPEHRTLLFITLATLLLMSFMRSIIMRGNDFGSRIPMFLQFSLLLLGSELVSSWAEQGAAEKPKTQLDRPFMRSALRAALCIGAVSTLSQMLMLRFATSILEAGYRGSNSSLVGSVTHNAYISLLGYQDLDRAIPSGAVVQFAPLIPTAMQTLFEIENVNHQVAMSADGPGCGSGAGGDATGCTMMLADIPPLFRHAGAEQARAVCRKYGIQYLIVNVYDPVWKVENSWVWNLKPVVADPEFRAVDCR